MTALAATAFVWVFILVPLIVVWVIGVVDIVRRPLSGMATAGWIVVVVVFPFVGTLVYFRCASRHRKSFGVTGQRPPITPTAEVTWNRGLPSTDVGPAGTGMRALPQPRRRALLRPPSPR
jgi:hypothetical protein